MEECLKQLLILIEDKQKELDKKLIDEEDAKHREHLVMFKDALKIFAKNASDFLMLVLVFSIMEDAHKD